MTIFFQKELDHMKMCYIEINGYPKWLLKWIFDSFETSNNYHNNNINDKNKNIRDINNLPDRGVHTLKLPYYHGINVIKSIKTLTKKTLSDNHDVRIFLRDTELKFNFNIKDDTTKQNKDNLISFRRCHFIRYLIWSIW